MSADKGPLMFFHRPGDCLEVFNGVSLLFWLLVEQHEGGARIDIVGFILGFVEFQSEVSAIALFQGLLVAQALLTKLATINQRSCVKYSDHCR